MKFTCNPPMEYDLKAGPRDGPAFFPIETLGPEVMHAALRAIAEHLGPETTIAALGTDANAKQFADAQTREAIRAVGYDPDQVGAAEVIGWLYRDRVSAEQLRKRIRERDEELQTVWARKNGLEARLAFLEYAIRQSLAMLVDDESAPYDYVALVKEAGRQLLGDTARAQLADVKAANRRLGAALREWGEAVESVRAAFQVWDRAVFSKSAYAADVLGAVRGLLAKADRLLSATPDEGAYDGEMARRLEAERECDRLRKRIKALEAEPESLRREIQRYYGKLTASDNERDAAIKRVGELEAELTEWRKACEPYGDSPGCARWFVERMKRAETAVEAMRTLLTTAQEESCQALADYDANKAAEPTGEQPQARVDKLEGATGAGKDGDANASGPRSDRTEESPPPARVVGGGKLEPLDLPCTLDCRDGVTMLATGTESVLVEMPRAYSSTVYLNRESVRRLRDWLTAWLGGTQ